MYFLRYNKKFPKDVKGAPRSVREGVVAILESKIQKDPLLYGKPLRGELRGLLSARIGEYRLVYEVFEDGEVYVIAFGHRREVYPHTARRLGR